MTQKELHKEAARLAKLMSDETEFTYTWNRKYKVWVEVDHDDMSSALLSDKELVTELGQAAKDLF